MTDLETMTGTGSRTRGQGLTTESHRLRMAARTARLLSGIAFGALIFQAPAAHAQVTPPDAPAVEEAAPAEDQSEIVVTGTQLRGIAPTGTNVVSMTRQDIIATGATSANEILSKIPQVSSAFLGTPTAPPGGLSIIRPNIRGLGASGTNTTLVIVDGHRMVGAGVVQSTPDPDVIPPGVLERIDVVPDGGSSIYGSDAIGGVINYISRKRFDGFEVSARTGFADNYRTTDVNVTAGKDWGSGSGYLSYSWAHNDAILGRDRDYVRQVTPNAGYCGAGTIFADTDGNPATPEVSYAINPGQPTSNLTPGTLAAACDVTDGVSLWPRTTRHNIFGSLSQNLSDAVTLDVRGYYADRRMTNFKGIVTTDLTVGPANPFFDPVAGETVQHIRTNLAGIYSDRYLNRLTSYGITPTLTADLGGNWQLRAMFNYGHSLTKTSETQLAGSVAEATLNPYNLASSTQSQLAAASLHNFGISNQDLVNVRTIADGPIFSLGGGEVRLAVGAEYYREKAGFQTASPTAFGAEDTVPVVRLKRNVKAVFGEVAVPVFGAANAVPGIHALTLSASARYDDYSDQGGTFNPKLGLTYEPVDWIKIRGNWGKSFNAPSLVDMTGTTLVVPVPATSSQVVGQTSPWALILIGNRGANVEPQTAKTWSLGIDITPHAVPGLTLSATYYNINMKKEISLLFGQPVTPAVAGLIDDPVPCVQALTQLGSQPLLSTLFGNTPPAILCAFVFQTPTVAVFDWRVQNLGQIKTDGVDFNLSYDRQVGFGTIHAGVAGTYTLGRKRAIVPGAPFVNTLDTPGISRLGLVATLGAQAGNFSASASLNHRGGYDINPVIPANPANPFPQAQSHVGSFTTVDAFFQYKLPEAWLPSETSLTLNVTNLFDQDPPFYNAASFGGSAGFTNGSTLGRVIQVGIRTKF